MKQTFFTFFMIFGLFTKAGWAREVEFSWNPMSQATKYEIQVDSSSKFEKPIVSDQSEKPAYSVKVDVGTYFFRVRGIDLKGRPGKWSQPTPLTVTAYPPEITSPNTGFETSYYEIFPTLEFSWKPVEGKDNSYEILIYKTTGQKVFEDSTKNSTFKTDKVGEGEFLWKVRTVTGKDLISPYCEPRRFVITKKNLVPPTLIAPAKDGIAAAYREVGFSWTKDPNTHFTDLYYEKLTGREGAKPFKKKIPNIPGTAYTADYEEPGNYKWYVTTKEGKDTPGVTSAFNDFEVRDDVITRGNYEFEVSLSPVSYLYTTTSARQTSGVSNIAQQSIASGNFVGFLGGYYFWQSLGVFLSTRSASMPVENLNAYMRETDLSLRLRFGSKGFNQEFILGYRLMDLIEAENSPNQETTDFTVTGPLIGSRVTATIVPGWSAQLYAYYFKPVSNIEGIGGLTSDVMGGSIGVKWNFMYQFWLGYRFQLMRSNNNFVTPGQAPSVNSSWTTYTTEPAYFSISFIH